MLQITKAQFAHFNVISFERYLDRLTSLLRSEAFVQDLEKHTTDTDSEQKIRAFARRLIERAASLGIKCEGDVTPFCLLAICIDPEFRQSGIYAWISHIVQATNYPAQKRMDAIYCLLPQSQRNKIFGQGAN